MNDPIQAAWEVYRYLGNEGYRAVVIGGLAVQFWGEPRLTVDADMTVISSVQTGMEPVVRTITSRFTSRVDNPIDFAKRTRMILIRTEAGIPVDISLGLPGYEEELFGRGKEVEISAGKSIRICSAEDLIIHKAVAGRPQDVRDIRGVVLRQRAKLDLAYIRKWLAEFALLLEDEAVAVRFEEALGE